MVAGLGCELAHVGAIETNGEVMDVVGVLVGMNTGGGEVDELCIFVDMEDLTNTPGATGDESPTPTLPKGGGRLTGTRFSSRSLLGNVFGWAIEIEVVPVVAFAGPEQAAVFEPTAPDAVVVHELVGTLLDEGGELTGLGIHRQELIELMATLVVLHGDITAVGSPLEPVEGVLKTHPQPLP